MRKVALFCAALFVGALGLTAVAAAIQGQQHITVKLQKNRAGTKAKPRSAGKITVQLSTDLVAGETPWAANHAVVHFDKNLVFSPKKFPTCSETQLRTDPTKCKAGSKVGSGTAAATVFAATAKVSDVAPTVTAFNGPGGKILLVVDEPSFSVHDVMVGTLKNDKAPYGKKLDVVIPIGLQNARQANVNISLTNFQTSVGGTRKGVPYVALKGCSGGKLKFAGDVSFTTGDTKSGTSTTTCRKG